MKTYSRFISRVSVVCMLCAHVVTEGNLRNKKQLGTGISFAFPGLNFLNGGSGNNNNAGNIFGQATFTRTIISTVSTVTTASFRTCTMPVGALAPCVGRRKREADMTSYPYDNEIFMDHEANNLGIDPSASIALIIGSTTLTDPLAVSEYLVAHQSSSQSIIYPQDITIEQIENLQKHEQPSESVILHPSSDSPDLHDDATTVRYEETYEDTLADQTTEIAVLDDPHDDQDEQTTPKLVLTDEEEKARAGFGKTTTVTTVIRVTSVATTLASGMMATLQISYMGCLPPSLPVSGVPC
ncbi:uncharacterized protein LOC110846562 [Folsomia candida]|uniref:Uncharacterized protein n=1 Tax=Folsomia candida TaxID=158441 RepID=A0A226EKF6_FOLCA|nr:uncharacterized protein LOC110846562 [Folsomia candida]OXA58193.1 hypothetical protein Fcan01_08121 [Folsomia candida]